MITIGLDFLFFLGLLDYIPSRLEGPGGYCCTGLVLGAKESRKVS